MYVETLRLTPQGMQAFTSAKDGGLYLRPTRCSFGDYKGSEPTAVPEKLIGNKVAEVSGIRFLEVLGGNIARFTFDIPADVPDKGEALIGEVLVSLEDGIPFAHVVLDEPIHKFRGNAHRISMLLYLQGEEDMARVFNVSMGEHVTLPQVTSVNWLPPIDSGMAASTVVVADLFTTADGGKVPGLAFRAGIAGNAWSFAGHDRVWSDPVGARFISPTQIKAEGMSEDLKTTDSIIVSVISGGGAGYCRSAEYDGKILQLNTDIPEIPLFTATSVIAVWVAGTARGSGGGIPLPDNTDEVPPDWVLTPGEDGGPPVWSPPSNNGSTPAQGVVLYSPPSKLVSKSLVTTATPSSLVYEMLEAVDSSADVMLVVGGATQPRTAFDVSEGDQLILSEAPDTNMDLNARAFVREPTTGHEMEITVVSLTGDGGSPEIDLGAGISDVEQVIAIVNRLQNPVTAYTITDGKLRFTENIPAGVAADLYCLRHNARIGASTKIIPHQFQIDLETSSFQLTVAPVSKSHVIILDTGTVVMQNEFQLIGDHIVMNTPLPAHSGRFIEILVFQNQVNSGSPDRSLEGVLTHAYLTPSGIQIERHGRAPLKVPCPRPIFSGRNGIVIDDSQFPMIRLSYAPDQDPAARKRTQIVAGQRSATDSEEIVFAQKIQIPEDMSMMINAEFSASLGPGFSSELHREAIECVVAIVEIGDKTPEYGSNARGTGRAGFSAHSAADDQAVVYADRHLTYSADIVADNYKARAVEVVAKMRVTGAKVSAYGSNLNVQVNIMMAR